MSLEKTELITTTIISAKEALNDYYIVCLSRQLSLLGRREVHNGTGTFWYFWRWQGSSTGSLCQSISKR